MRVGSRGLVAVGVGVFALALVALVAQVALEDPPALHVSRWLSPTLPLAMLLGAAALFWVDRPAALLVPCLLAPLAALTPWVLAPSHFGVALGGAPFFVGWLTRYPTLGGVNHEVLLGMGAMLGCCALPSWFALYAASAGRSRRVLAALAVLQLVSYAPVLIRLDGPLLLCAPFLPALSGLGPMTGAEMAGGALARLIASACVVAVAARPWSGTGSPPPSSPDPSPASG